MYVCGECDTECKGEGSAIGPYCPNQDCPIADGPGLEEVE